MQKEENDALEGEYSRSIVFSHSEFGGLPDGLVLQKIPNSNYGHCLFQAVSLYLYASEDSARLRKIVTAHIEANKDTFGNFIDLPTTINDYLKSVREGEESARHLEIKVLMRVLDRPIIVLDKKFTISNPDILDDFMGRPIFVYFTGDHYDALLLKDNCIGKHVLNYLLQPSEHASESSEGRKIKSRLQSRQPRPYKFDKENWVVSLVNTGPGEGTGDKLFGHAVILVEGVLEDGSLFIGEYDITGNSFPEEQSWIQSLLGNVEGYITKIRCNPKHYGENNDVNAKFFKGTYRDYRLKKYSSKSWYVPRQAAKRMIRAIEADADTLDGEIQYAAQPPRRNVNWPFKYQKAGSYRWWIWGGNGGESCITWAEKKLAIAGAGNGRVFTDSGKASTEVHVKCVVS